MLKKTREKKNEEKNYKKSFAGAGSSYCEVTASLRAPKGSLDLV
jgi:hypothetical protein